MVIEPRIQIIAVRDRLLHWQFTESEVDRDLFNELYQVKLSAASLLVPDYDSHYAYLSYRSHQRTGHICRVYTCATPASSF